MAMKIQPGEVCWRKWGLRTGENCYKTIFQVEGKGREERLYSVHRKLFNGFNIIFLFFWWGEGASQNIISVIAETGHPNVPVRSSEEAQWGTELRSGPTEALR